MTKEWFVLKNSVETGPFDKQGILLRVRKGILTPDDMIRKENTTQWRPLGQIKGLFPEAKVSQSPPVIEPATSMEATEAKTKNPFLSRLLSNANITAVLAAKNVSLKNMKLSALPKAFQKLGRAAYDHNVGEAAYPDLYAAIKEITERMKAR